MRRLATILLLLVLTMGLQAETGTAFKGIWPVTDHSLMKSLNGEWQLKVVKGVTDDKTVPGADISRLC